MPLSPTISDIYAAFDAGAHQVFRGAMARSRGGLVRLNDLLAAIVDSRSIPEELIPPQWRQLAALESHAPWMTPMSNEPALRDVLRSAHALAEAEGGSITPTTLFAAALARSQPRPVYVSATPAPVRTQPPTVSPAPVPAARLSSAERRDVIEAWFRKWIAAQRAGVS